MTSRLVLLLLTSVSASAALVPWGLEALAQDETADKVEAAADPARGGLERMVVTARRREESEQDVGIALTTFTGEELIDQGIRTINAIENFTPNVEIESQFGSGQPSFSIRGIGFRDYATNNASTVGFYVDEVAYPFPVMTQGVLFDVERVEVLRGPQGTLYGRNTTGGAIKLVSARPQDTFGAGLVIEAGRFGRVDTEGFVTGGLTDRARVRLSGRVSRGGAWQVNRETGEALGDADLFALRGLFEFDLSSTFTALVNVHGFQDQSDGQGLQLFTDSSLGGVPAHDGPRETSWGSSAEFAELVGFGQDQAPFRDSDGLGVNLTVEGTLGAVDVVYIGAFETLNRKEFNDFDALVLGGASTFFVSDIDVQTHELRFSGVINDRLRWLAGGYYAAEDLEELYRSDFVDSFGPGFAVSTPYAQEVRTVSVFVNWEYDLTDDFRLIGGVRYEDEERDLIGLGTFATGFGTFNFANGTVDGTLEDRSLDITPLTGRVAMEATPTDNILVYASYSRGIKSGGFTAYNTLNPQAIDPFVQERLNAYEVGLKSEWLNNTLRLNAAGFYYNYKDQQVQSAIFDPATNAIVGRIVNAPESEIYGAELEVMWAPLPGVEISQAFGYKTGEYIEFTDLDTGATGASGTEVLIDRAGQSLGFPEFSYVGSVTAQGDVSEAMYWRFRFDVSYRDNLALPLLGPLYEVDGYFLGNATLAFGSTDGRWEIALWGRNIFDTEYDETRNFFIAPNGVADVAATGLPATAGVRLTLNVF
ncbi:MAG: TonB-dependent receptor [Alphaproteobacteria bacterium]